MDPVLLVSPHLDDAVLSCGQFLAGRPDVTVLTLFAGTPKDPTVLTDFDRRSGFANAAEALMRRHREDRAALGSLGAFAYHASFVDNQYRSPGTGHALPAYVDEIVKAAQLSGATMLIGPLGLVHPDHVTASEAVLAAAGTLLDLPLWLFEELPARVLWPERVGERLAHVDTAGFDVELAFIGTGDLVAKQRAIRHYRSQLWALDLHCCLVPERFWRATCRA